MIHVNPKSYKNNHILIMCSLVIIVLMYGNSDCNGATNIYKIAESHINKNIRPSYLCRCNLSDVLHDTSKSKSKFTCSEMGKPCWI